ncbi:protein arginine kinase [Desulfofalx alkaliphila]|uniref:protein arginine kinase n=1 Tax=Desulfofalx alkaliphila TaxID=105483 RepID=UPI0004E185C8|nr:protein arginine kinase [Desulfofalx alkaliphila]
MGLKSLLNSAHVRWMDGNGPESDVVISSRIRVARNFKDVIFPHLMKESDAEPVFHAVQLVTSQPQTVERFGSMDFVRITELTPVERRLLMEKHLISPDLLKDIENKAVVISEDQEVNIMLNEEDHLRIQCLLPGLQLNKGWQMVDELDDLLEQTIDYAYSEQFGYLTVCPTNIGTGLRASVMLHLPGLTMLKQMGSVITAISKIGLTVRGLHGEGSGASGNIYQVSNQITLGHTEEEIINNLTFVIKQLIDQERNARKVLHRDNRHPLEDKIFRAYGVLKNARMLTSGEAMKLISDVRLGVELGIIKDVSQQLLNELTVIITPAFLLKQMQRDLSAEERDVLRAQKVRESLNKGIG